MFTNGNTIQQDLDYNLRCLDQATRAGNRAGIRWYTAMVADLEAKLTAEQVPA